MEDFRWIYEEDEAQVAEISFGLQSGARPRSFSANRNYRKDGSVACCEWYNSALLDDSGNLRSIYKIPPDQFSGLNISFKIGIVFMFMDIYNYRPWSPSCLLSVARIYTSLTSLRYASKSIRAVNEHGMPE